MCYYNGVKVTHKDFLRLTVLESKVEQWMSLNRPIVNGFDYGTYPILMPTNNGKVLNLQEAHWELIPPMVASREGLADFRKRYNTLNAKGENLLTSPFYKSAALQRRCLVLSSGFYEWRKYSPRGSKREQSYPYHIRLRDQPLFFMAGIYQPWTDKETGENMDTFSVVTARANSLIELVHNSKRRMPTILPEKLALEWIQPSLAAERIAQLATYQIAPGAMECYTIHKDFRIMDDPAEACHYPDLPGLGADEAPSQAPTLF